jgi:hypothetical protein
MADDVTLDWHGDEVLAAVLAAMSPVMGRIGLMVEGEAKKQLTKGHGVITGTLRRSIHCAEEGYVWSGDNVEPDEGTPELGNNQVNPEPNEIGLSIEVGSGLLYAMPVHQGRGSFQGYHYLTNAVEIVRQRVPGIVAEMMR